MKYQSEFNEMSRAIATLYSIMIQHEFTEEQMLAHIETGFHIAKTGTGETTVPETTVPYGFKFTRMEEVIPESEKVFL